jgi:hypothetical protein
MCAGARQEATTKAAEPSATYASMLGAARCARARNPARSAWGHARQLQHNIIDRGNDPPQFARAGQNIATAVMLLRCLPEPVDPLEQAIH